MNDFKQIVITRSKAPFSEGFYVVTMDDFEPCELAGDELLGVLAQVCFAPKLPMHLTRTRLAEPEPPKSVPYLMGPSAVRPSSHIDPDD